jgi:hypothetical protein
MEPEGSLSCSQEPATVPYPEPDESNSHPPTVFPEDQFQYYPPIYSHLFSMYSWNGAVTKQLWW